MWHSWLHSSRDLEVRWKVKSKTLVAFILWLSRNFVEELWGLAQPHIAHIEFMEAWKSPPCRTGVWYPRGDVFSMGVVRFGCRYCLQWGMSNGQRVDSIPAEVLSMCQRDGVNLSPRIRESKNQKVCHDQGTKWWDKVKQIFWQN